MAAFYCGVSRNTFLRWIEAKKLPEGKKEGGRVLWDRETVDQALDMIMGVQRNLDSTDGIDHDEEARILREFSGG
jgi:excisionase family DNA binding protein